MNQPLSQPSSETRILNRWLLTQKLPTCQWTEGKRLWSTQSFMGDVYHTLPPKAQRSFLKGGIERV